MSEQDISKFRDYVSIKEAANMLGLSYTSMREHVINDHIKSEKVGHIFLIHKDDVKNFKPAISGRPRTTVPRWRISPEDNTLLRTLIYVRIRKGCKEAFLQKLDEIRQKKEEHLFLGTLARYIIGSKRQPDMVEIALIWRTSVMPDEAAREQTLEAFRQELAEVLDWETAQYDEGTVLMHT